MLLYSHLSSANFTHLNAMSIPMKPPTYLPHPPLFRFPTSRPLFLRPLCTAAPPHPPPAKQQPHIPVLLSPLLSNFSSSALSPTTFLDLTVGAGSHAHALLSAFPIRHYIALDKDPSALILAREKLSCFSEGTRLDFIRGDFTNLDRLLMQHGLRDLKIDAAMLDAGVSSMQLDSAERGFSFMRDGPLDMRMDAGIDGGLSAKDIVNGANEETLARIFWEFGEEKQSKRVARAVVKERESGGEIKTTAKLADIVVGVKGWKKGKGVHPATLVFQALRISVNEELKGIENGCEQVVNRLNVGGRFGVITFHSLEDRVVKRCFKDWGGRVGGVGWVNRKPIVADEEEIRSNARSRSAKLRVVQRLREGEEPWGRKVNKYRKESLEEGG